MEELRPPGRMEMMDVLGPSCPSSGPLTPPHPIWFSISTVGMMEALLPGVAWLWAPVSPSAVGALISARVSLCSPKYKRECA